MDHRFPGDLLGASCGSIHSSRPIAFQITRRLSAESLARAVRVGPCVTFSPPASRPMGACPSRARAREGPRPSTAAGAREAELYAFLRAETRREADQVRVVLAAPLTRFRIAVRRIVYLLRLRKRWAYYRHALQGRTVSGAQRLQLWSQVRRVDGRLVYTNASLDRSHPATARQLVIWAERRRRAALARRARAPW